MTTFVRTGRMGHRAKDTWIPEYTPVEQTAEDRERIAREDAEIKRRRDALPLH